LEAKLKEVIIHLLASLKSQTSNYHYLHLHVDFSSNAEEGDRLYYGAKDMERTYLGKWDKNACGDCYWMLK